MIRLKPFEAGRPDGDDLRRVVIWLEEKPQELVLLTNNIALDASAIAAIGKALEPLQLPQPLGVVKPSF